MFIAALPLLLACSPGWSASPDPVLNEFTIESIHDAERARVALARLADARRDYLENWQIRSNECRRRIAVNRCQSELKAERQAFEGKSGEIEVHARQVIRNETLTERNSAEARNGPREPNSSERASGAAEAKQRASRVQQQDARMAEHEASLARRKQLGLIEADKRLERMAALEQRRREKQRKLEEGRKLAARKQTESDAKAAKPKEPAVPASRPASADSGKPAKNP